MSIVKNLALLFMNTTNPITAKSRNNIRECLRQCQDWWYKNGLGENQHKLGLLIFLIT